MMNNRNRMKMAEESTILAANTNLGICESVPLRSYVELNAFQRAFKQSTSDQQNSQNDVWECSSEIHNLKIQQQLSMYMNIVYCTWYACWKHSHNATIFISSFRVMPLISRVRQLLCVFYHTGGLKGDNKTNLSRWFDTLDEAGKYNNPS